MNGYIVALFFATFITGVCYVVFYFTTYQHIRRGTQKYPLFAARDEFIRLRLDGHFDNDPDLFKHYCELCNKLIVNSQGLNFWIFVQALPSVTTDTARLKALQERVKKSTVEVRRADELLWNAVLAILYENSTFLRITLRASFALSLLDAVPPQFQEASFMLPVQEYRKIKNIHGLVYG
jgi:hypothetical protein